MLSQFGTRPSSSDSAGLRYTDRVCHDPGKLTKLINFSHPRLEVPPIRAPKLPRDAYHCGDCNRGSSIGLCAAQSPGLLFPLSRLLAALWCP
jgi:hypothetical protein